MADAFSTGPYTVDILEGNEQDRFEVKDGAYTVTAPVTPAPPTFTFDGETIILCPNATDDPVEPIPAVNSGTAMGFVLSKVNIHSLQTIQSLLLVAVLLEAVRKKERRRL